MPTEEPKYVELFSRNSESAMKKKKQIAIVTMMHTETFNLYGTYRKKYVLITLILIAC